MQSWPSILKMNVFVTEISSICHLLPSDYWWFLQIIPSLRSFKESQHCFSAAITQLMFVVFGFFSMSLLLCFGRRRMWDMKYNSGHKTLPAPHTSHRVTFATTTTHLREVDTGYSLLSNILGIGRVNNVPPVSTIENQNCICIRAPM